jgi:uncharacterized membrane protein
MEEEKKEVVQAEEQPQQGGMTPNSKNALAAFIASVVGVCFSAGWFIGAIIGIVGGALGLSWLKKINGEVEKQPFRTFGKIAKPVSIVSLILGILSLIGWFIWLIVVIVAAVAAATAGA